MGSCRFEDILWQGQTSRLRWIEGMATAYVAVLYEGKNAYSMDASWLNLELSREGTRPSPTIAVQMRGGILMWESKGGRHQYATPLFSQFRAGLLWIDFPGEDFHPRYRR